jgi:predicted nucleotidyltransferase
VSTNAPNSIDLEPLLQAIRAQLPGVVGVWLFGSVSRGQAGPGSDIDLAVLADAPIDGVVLFDLGLELGVIANRDVDLIDLRRASTVLRKEVVSGGRLAWTADAAACEAFAGDSMALYVALKEEQALASRGSGARGSGARGTNR